MNQLLTWVRSVEEQAEALYREAARYFATDPELSAFLRRLADEECGHVSLLALGEDMPPPSGVEAEVVVLDDDTRGYVERLFSGARTRMTRGELDRDEMIAVIAAVEFSEWNEFFLYAVGMLRGGVANIELACAEIERHKEGIVEFFRAIPDGGRYLATVGSLPVLRGKNILLIEQRPALALLLRHVLSTIGEVDVVPSGTAGLERLDERHYDVILADIDMSAMDSLDFYRQAVGVHPTLARKFVFFVGKRDQAGVLPDEATTLAKPAMVSQICLAVAGIAHGERVMH